MSGSEGELDAALHGSRLLYHFTAVQHLPSILKSANLKTVESNISPKRTNAGPDVVWLTTEPTAHLGLGLQHARADKTEIRFTVRVGAKEAHEWRTWAYRHYSPKRFMDVLAESGGAETWHVIERLIPASDWVEIRNMKTDSLIDWP